MYNLLKSLKSKTNARYLKKYLLRRALRGRCLCRKRARKEAVSLPAVNLVNNSLADELVLANLGQNDRPDKPVDTTGEDDTKSYHTVNPVGQVFVNVLALRRLDERCDNKVHVTEAEEDGDWQRSLDWGIPVSLLAVEVKVYEAATDKGVDDCEGVGDKAAIVSN